MSTCAILKEQEALRDLAQLPRLVADIDRVDDADAVTSALPLVLSGVRLQESPLPTIEMIKRRSDAGLTSIIVPRLQARDYGSLFGIPSPMKVALGAYEKVCWDDGDQMVVPGQLLIESPLHVGRWATTLSGGTAVLAYRAHQAAGAIVFCTASLCSRPPGISLAEQIKLMQAILDRSSSGTKVEDALPGSVDACEDGLEAFFAREPDAAALGLAIVATGGSREPEVLAATAGRLGLATLAGRTASLVAAAPETGVDEIEDCLRKHGWGAYVRRARQMVETVYE